MGKIARNVNAFSLLKSAKKSVKNNKKMLFMDGFSMYEIKHKKDEMPKSNAKISSRPFILATTSVWIGWIQKRNAHRNGILNTRSLIDLKGLKLNSLYIKMKIKLHNKP